MFHLLAEMQRIVGVAGMIFSVIFILFIYKIYFGNRIDYENIRLNGIATDGVVSKISLIDSEKKYVGYYFYYNDKKVGGKVCVGINDAFYIGEKVKIKHIGFQSLIDGVDILHPGIGNEIIPFTLACFGGLLIFLFCLFGAVFRCPYGKKKRSLTGV